jgi:hypothetical protein
VTRLKKIDRHEIQDFEPIDISFEKKDSTFHADFLGKHFSNPDINKLKTALREEAESRKKIAWKPVIIVTAGQWEWERHVSGLEFEIMFLGTIVLPDGVTRQVLSNLRRKEMFKDDLDVSNWVPDYSQKVWKGDSKETKLIDYTEDRYKTLVFMEERMKEFKLGLRDTIIGEACGNFLDVLSGNRDMFLPGDLGKKQLIPATDQDGGESPKCQ